MSDAIEWGKSIAVMVKGYVAKTAGALGARMDAIEKTLAELPVPKDGTSVTAEDVRPMIAEQVAEVVAKLPRAKDGKDADPADVQRMVDEAVAALPAPKDGQSVTVEQVMPELKAALESAVAAIPVPKDGASVTLADVMEGLEGHFAKWELDFERRAQELFQRAIDRMPAPKDGRDCVDLASFDAELAEDGRTLTLSMVAGETKVSKSVTLPTVLDRGVYRAEHTHEKNDGVTWDGSFWIAQKNDPAGKPGESPDWRLAVKHGRPGKDAKPVSPGPSVVTIAPVPKGDRQ